MNVLTKPRQRLAVAQGLALGVTMRAEGPITGVAMNLQFAFRHAWRDWPYRDWFPGVHAGPHQDDVLLILDAEVRRGRRGVAWWTSAWPYVASADGDDWDDMAELIGGGVPAAAWGDLVAAWLHPTARQ